MKWEEVEQMLRDPAIRAEVNRMLNERPLVRTFKLTPEQVAKWTLPDAPDQYDPPSVSEFFTNRDQPRRCL